MIFQFLFFAKIDILPNSSPTFGVDPKLTGIISVKQWI